MWTTSNSAAYGKGDGTRRQSRKSFEGPADSLGPVDFGSERARAQHVVKKNAQQSELKDNLKWPSDQGPPRKLPSGDPSFVPKIGGDASSYAHVSRIEKPNRTHIVGMLNEQQRASQSEPSEPRLSKRLSGVAEPPQRVLPNASTVAVNERTERGLQADETRRIRSLYETDREAFEAHAAQINPAEPLSDRQKLALATAELRRKKPHLSEIEALEQIGDALNKQLNLANNVAVDYFRARNQR